MAEDDNVVPFPGVRALGPVSGPSYSCEHFQGWGSGWSSPPVCGICGPMQEDSDG